LRKVLKKVDHMINPNFRIRRGESTSDAAKLHILFDQVFTPEPIGKLAEMIFLYQPHIRPDHWFIVEDPGADQFMAAFVLIPWTWQMEGVPLKVAEMGIVGTLEEMRGQGLMRSLNVEFDRILASEGYDLAVIQGIPGFYGQFGYQYALPLENHLNLALHRIPDLDPASPFTFRPIKIKDIPYLLEEEKRYQAAYHITCVRDEANWRYLLTHSQSTVQASEYWLLTGEAGEKAFARLPLEGFGEGQIINEMSVEISHAAFGAFLNFFKQRAAVHGKPYLRFNLPNDCAVGRMAQAYGAEPGEPYAWQVKFPDVATFLSRVGSRLTNHLKGSPFANFSGHFRLNLYRKSIDLVFNDGEFLETQPGSGQVEMGIHLPAYLLPALLLGWRSWKELRHIQPDVFPSSPLSAVLVDTLFPLHSAWIYQQY
jgi:predicted N-acetyltransferase YhbS